MGCGGELLRARRLSVPAPGHGIGADLVRGATPPVAPAELSAPPGWTVTQASDRATRMVPGRQWRFRAGRFSFLRLPLLLVVAAGSIRLGQATRRPSLWPEWVTDALLAAGMLLMGLGVLLCFLLREEWWVGPDFLEIRAALGSFRRARRYREAMLELRETHRYTYRGWEREYVIYRLLIHTPIGRTATLASASQPADLRALGYFLCEQTGWLMSQSRL